MADIKIEKKKNRPVWPWILGLLLLAGIIWLIASSDNDPEREQVATNEQTYQEEPVTTDRMSNRNVNEAAQAQSFVSFVEENAGKDEMATDHNMTAEGLMRLSAALEDLSQGENTYSQQISQIRQSAEQIQSDPQSTQHAARVSNAFYSAADVMEQLQQNRFQDADSEVEDVRQSAEELEPNQQLLDQKDKVNEFFENAADAVEKMEEQLASNNG